MLWTGVGQLVVAYFSEKHTPGCQAKLFAWVPKKKVRVSAFFAVAPIAGGVHCEKEEVQHVACRIVALGLY